MNYSMIVNKAKSPLGINLRDGAGVAFQDIGDLSVDSIAEGDELVKDVNGQDWLHVLMIDGMQTSVPTYAAAWLCDVTVNPPAVGAPDLRVDLTINSNQTVTCKVYSNDTLISDVTVPYGFPAGG
jgi:hypothetical protein